MAEKEKKGRRFRCVVPGSGGASFTRGFQLQLSAVLPSLRKADQQRHAQCVRYSSSLVG